MDQPRGRKRLCPNRGPTYYHPYSYSYSYPYCYSYPYFNSYFNGHTHCHARSDFHPHRHTGWLFHPNAVGDAQLNRDPYPRPTTRFSPG